jgi:hypothetical protein
MARQIILDLSRLSRNAAIESFRGWRTLEAVSQRKRRKGRKQ